MAKTEYFNNKFEELNRECLKHESELDYYQIIDRNSSDATRTSYDLGILRKKYQVLRSLTGLPDYSEVKAMSDIELEQHKRKQKSQLESEIDEISSGCEHLRNKIINDKKIQQKNAESFSSLSQSEKSLIIGQGKQLAQEIRSDEYKLKKLMNILREKKDELEQIDGKSLEQVRYDMLGKVENSTYTGELVDGFLKKPLTRSEEMIASIAEDPIKSGKMAYLLTLYGILSNSENNVRASLHLPTHLPARLHDQINASLEYDEESHKVSDVSEIIHMYEDFYQDFLEAKEMFEKQYTWDKMDGLVGHYFEQPYMEIDNNFLDQHRDKIALGELEVINSLVDRYNTLSWRIIKTRNAKNQMSNINNEIQNRMNDIYRRIINWYKISIPEILGIPQIIDFSSRETLGEFMSSAEIIIKLSDAAMSLLKQRLDEAKTYLDEEHGKYDNERDEITERIHGLVSPEYANVAIPYVTCDQKENEDMMINLVGREYAREVIKDIAQEAGNTARQNEDALMQIEGQKSLGEGQVLALKK